MKCDRRRFLQLMTACTGLAVVAGCGQRSSSTSPIPSLGIGGSPILLTLPLAYLIEESSLSNVVADIQFNPVRNHEQMKALLTSEQGQVAANPTLLSAGLYKQALPIQLLNVMIWGNIFVISPDESVTHWEDLRGKSVLIPFKGGMPEMIFQFLAMQVGLQPDQDVTIQSTQDFQSTAQLLLAGQGDAGVFSEPQASSVVIKAQQQNLELFYNLDFKEAWGQATGQAARFPQAGIVALRSLVDSQPEVVDMIQTELQNSLDWIQQNPTAAAELGSKYMDIPPPVIERSLQNNLFEYVSAAQAKPELEVFFTSLMQVNPQLMKGQLPSPEFYGVG